MMDTNFYLSDADIEKQANTDLLNYELKIKREATLPIYPEEIAENLWQVKIEYKDHVFDKDGNEVLGLFDPKKKTLVISNSQNEITGRLSFTAAHELGHVSLHRFLHEEKEVELIYDIKNLNFLEIQADKYAGCILMPKRLVENKLSTMGLKKSEKVNLKVHGKKLANLFGVSIQALEIRLANLGFSMTGRLYDKKSNKITERILDEMDGAREIRLSRNR